MSDQQIEPEVNEHADGLRLGEDGQMVVDVKGKTFPVLKADGTPLCDWDIVHGQKIDLHFDRRLNAYRSDVGLSRRKRRFLRALRRK